MDRTRLAALGILALAVLVAGLYAVAPRARTALPAGMPPVSGATKGAGAQHRLLAATAQSYPRLANYNGLQYPWQVPFMANDDLIVARRGAPLSQLARANPHALTMLYERTLQVDLCCGRSLYGINVSDMPPGWWLTTPGSGLLAPINATQRWVRVADPRPFAACQDVMIDGESMHVWQVRGDVLQVWRGYYSKAAPHPFGARVMIHYSYRTDLSNCHLSGRGANPRPWSFNLSSLCPRYHGQTWADYLAHYVAMLVRRDGWGGVFYDNLYDLPPTIYADTDGDGRADGGIIRGVDIWREGERHLLAETRRLLPGVPIMINGDLLIDGVADGREMEAFPVFPGADASAAIDAYRYDTAAGRVLTIVNADSVLRPVPSMPAIELAVGAALLGGGYVAYDHGWRSHGYPWWFDEYDRGAGSATLQPVNAAAMVLPVVHPARFHQGNVVLLDQEAARVLRVLAGGLLVQRGVDGTMAAPHPVRTVVTTWAQRTAGHGYLGRPLDPARVVPTANWARYAIPLLLLRGQASTGGHMQDTPALPLTPDTAWHVSSTLHYYPTITQLHLVAPHVHAGLRTFVIWAHGPAGQTFWLYDGPTRVPLVLRPRWHRYVVPLFDNGDIVLGLGRVSGEVFFHGAQLIGVQGFVLRRDFTHGIVIVNPTDVTQTVTLERPYHVLAGDQDPWANSGKLTRIVSIARCRATILLD